MDELAKAYIDVINEYDPYIAREELLEAELSEMLYNLEQINEELTESQAADFDEDLYYFQEHLKAVIAQFKAKGVEII